MEQIIRNLTELNPEIVCKLLRGFFLFQQYFNNLLAAGHGIINMPEVKLFSEIHVGAGRTGVGLSFARTNERSEIIPAGCPTTSEVRTAALEINSTLWYLKSATNSTHSNQNL